jgi:hypothetical protein
MYAGKHVGGYAAYKSSKAVKTGHAYGSKKPDDEVGKRDVVMSGTALVAKAACVCRCGCKDCGGSGDRVKKARCNCSCPTCGGGVHKSAFGVEHEIAKLGLAPVEDAWKGLKVGAAGKSFGAAPGSMSGMLGAKTGNVARKGAMGGANFMRTNPVAGAGTAAGVGAGGGLALSRKGNN